MWMALEVEGKKENDLAKWLNKMQQMFKNAGRGIIGGAEMIGY
jgi:hypothetical protein